MWRWRSVVRNFRNGGFVRAPGLAVVGMASLSSVTFAQTPPSQPTYANGEIHCPDGTRAIFHSSGEAPSDQAMLVACSFGSAAESPPPATALPLPTASPTFVDPMASLQRDPFAKKGEVRCPDGTARPFDGDQSNDLVVSAVCSVSAEVAAERHRRATIAVDEKNRVGRLQAALRGDDGVWAGLQATWETGSLDYVLRFRATWIIGLVLGALLIARLFGAKR